LHFSESGGFYFEMLKARVVQPSLVCIVCPST